jgi:hypothetical protein
LGADVETDSAHFLAYIDDSLNHPALYEQQVEVVMRSIVRGGVCPQSAEKRQCYQVFKHWLRS